jgi:hypothetical protein
MPHRADFNAARQDTTRLRAHLDGVRIEWEYAEGRTIKKGASRSMAKLPKGLYRRGKSTGRGEVRCQTLETGGR